jgi:calcineurin-like phosphoesterase family protein
MTIFRDDIDPARTWIVSDTHFGHRNIIEFCHRPPDHDQLIMENWAREVPEDATVIHLGDLCYKGNSFFKNMIAPKLTGARKLLVKGNHDHGRYSFYKASGFKLARPFSIMWGDTEVSFSHYPWNAEGDEHFKIEPEGPMPPNHLRLHGHIHNNGYTRAAFVPFLAQHVNLSIEQTKYKPVNLALLLSSVVDGRVVHGEPRPGLEDVEKESHHA